MIFVSTEICVDKSRIIQSKKKSNQVSKVFDATNTKPSAAALQRLNDIK